jgi:hypothetical protein
MATTGKYSMSIERNGKIVGLGSVDSLPAAIKLVADLAAQRGYRAGLVHETSTGKIVYNSEA